MFAWLPLCFLLRLLLSYFLAGLGYYWSLSLHFLAGSVVALVLLMIRYCVSFELQLQDLCVALPEKVSFICCFSDFFILVRG